MSHSNVDQQYKLSVVSGGKPIIPHALNLSSANKSLSCLTHDQQNYIVPFNNQIKIYSIETRQCVKILKYANNETVSNIFSGNSDEVYVVDIKLSNLLSANADDSTNDDSNRDITIFTNNGHIISLNYKGKLVDNPKNLKLELEEDEEVLKVFENIETNQFKILTTKLSNSRSTVYDYKIYDFNTENDGNVLTLQETFNDIILSTWSKNEKYLALLSFDSENKKSFAITSLFDDSTKTEFKQNDIVSASKENSSANSKYISTMALDNSGSKLALGFASGVINMVNLTDLSSTLLKWHIDTVLSLCFNDDSSYLISGGWEKVVSFWQLATNNQQFLPRVNGVIIDCKTLGDDKYYALALQMSDNISNSDFQLILLNATDLTSKLAINGPLPVFNSAVKNTIHPLSAIKSRSSTTIQKASMSQKKFKKKLLKAKKQDYTNNATIHPVSKQIFFPHMSAVQIYDFFKNEQVSYQYLAQGINTSMGKVRDELNLKGPVINDIQFTMSGKWMITYEVDFPPEDLLSSRDLTYSLKFWTKNDNELDWRLVTKVLNPHGINAPITKILPAPANSNNSEGCITADNNGGLKYWAFDHHEKNWCLKKLALPYYNNYSNSVSLAWSKDGSLIFHGFDDKFTIIDFDTFRKLAPSFQNENDHFLNELTLDSEIQAIKLVKESILIIATQTVLCSLDLLKGKIINSFDIYPYTQGIFKNGHLDRLISCDEKTGKIALVINEQNNQGKSKYTVNYKSRIIVFNSDLSERSGIFNHDEYISWISWNYDTDFIFLDISSQLGIVGTTVNSEMLDEVNDEGLLSTLASDKDFSEQLRKLTSLKNSLNNGVEDNSNKMEEINEEDEEDMRLEFINGNNKENTINMNSFTSIFDNIQNIQMDTLFDRVMKVVL